MSKIQVNSSIDLVKVLTNELSGWRLYQTAIDGNFSYPIFLEKDDATKTFKIAQESLPKKQRSLAQSFKNFLIIFTIVSMAWNVKQYLDIQMLERMIYAGSGASKENIETTLKNLHKIEKEKKDIVGAIKSEISEK